MYVNDDEFDDIFFNDNDDIVIVKKDNKQVWNVTKKVIPNVSDMENFVRASDGCFEIVSSSALGACLIPVKDPEANTILTDFDKHGIKLIPDFPKISKEVWARIINFYFHYCGEIKNATRDTEVSVVFLRRQDDLSQWKVVVPEQIVDAASVRANFNKCVDIVTGKQYDSFPPIDEVDGESIIWVHAGSSHSHQTMQAFFSSTDDKSELGIPGLHIVVGEINIKKSSYVPKESIVLRGCRKNVDVDDVVDTTPIGVKFHENCLAMVTVESLSRVIYGGGHNYGGGGFYGSYSPSRAGADKANVWIYGAQWNNKVGRWVHGEYAKHDIIHLKNGKDVVGRISRMGIKGVGIKTSTSPHCETFILFCDIIAIGTDNDTKKDSSLEDTDLMLLPGKVEESALVLSNGCSSREIALRQLMNDKDFKLPPMV